MSLVQAAESTAFVTLWSLVIMQGIHCGSASAVGGPRQHLQVLQLRTRAGSSGCHIQWYPAASICIVAGAGCTYTCSVVGQEKWQGLWPIVGALALRCTILAAKSCWVHSSGDWTWGSGRDMQVHSWRLQLQVSTMVQTSDRRQCLT